MTPKPSKRPSIQPEDSGFQSAKRAPKFKELVVQQEYAETREQILRLREGVTVEQYRDYLARPENQELIDLMRANKFSVASANTKQIEQLKQLLTVAKLWMIQDASDERNFVRVDETIIDHFGSVDRMIVNKDLNLREGLLPLFSHFNLRPKTQFWRDNGQNVSSFLSGVEIEKVLIDYDSKPIVETIFTQGEDQNKIKRPCVRIAELVDKDGNSYPAHNVFVSIYDLESQFRVEFFQSAFNDTLPSQNVDEIIQRLKMHGVEDFVNRLDDIYLAYGPEMLKVFVKKCFEIDESLKCFYYMDRLLEYLPESLFVDLIVKHANSMKVIDNIFRFWEAGFTLDLDFQTKLVEKIMLSDKETKLFECKEFQKSGISEEFVMDFICDNKLWSFAFKNLGSLSSFVSSNNFVKLTQLTLKQNPELTLQFFSVENMDLLKKFDKATKKQIWKIFLESRMWKKDMTLLRTIVMAKLFDVDDLREMFSVIIDDQDWKHLFYAFGSLRFRFKKDQIYNKFWLEVLNLKLEINLQNMPIYLSNLGIIKSVLGEDQVKLIISKFYLLSHKASIKLYLLGAKYINESLGEEGLKIWFHAVTPHYDVFLKNYQDITNAPVKEFVDSKFESMFDDSFGKIFILENARLVNECYPDLVRSYFIKLTDNQLLRDRSLIYFDQIFTIFSYNESIKLFKLVISKLGVNFMNLIVGFSKFYTFLKEDDLKFVLDVIWNKSYMNDANVFKFNFIFRVYGDGVEHELVDDFFDKTLDLGPEVTSYLFRYPRFSDAHSLYFYKKVLGTFVKYNKLDDARRFAEKIKVPKFTDEFVLYLRQIGQTSMIEDHFESFASLINPTDRTMILDGLLQKNQFEKLFLSLLSLTEDEKASVWSKFVDLLLKTPHKNRDQLLFKVPRSLLPTLQERLELRLKFKLDELDIMTQTIRLLQDRLVDVAPEFPVTRRVAVIINGDMDETRHTGNVDRAITALKAQGFDSFYIVGDATPDASHHVFDHSLEGIDQMFRALGATLQKDNLVFFYGTGHGDKDSSMVIGEQRYKMQQMIKHFSVIKEKGARGVFTFDTCYSGSIPAAIYKAGIQGIALSPAPEGKTAMCQYFAPRFFDSIREGKDVDASGRSDIFEIATDAFDFYRDKVSSREGEVMASVPELTMSNVESIENSKKPVLILQSETWCPPCQIFKKMLASVMHRLNPSIKVVVITTDINSQKDQLKERLQLKSAKALPSFSLRMPDGSNTDLNAGALDFAGLKSWLAENGVHISEKAVAKSFEESKKPEDLSEVKLDSKISEADKKNVKYTLEKTYQSWLPEGYSIKFVSGTDNLVAVCKGNVCFHPESKFSPYDQDAKLNPEFKDKTVKAFLDSVYDDFKIYIKTLSK